MKRRLSHLQYLIGAGGVMVALLALVLAFNALVDPLWYLEGNLINGRNYGFNERQAKLDRLLAHRGEYDCLILGSSRVTLLDAGRVRLGRCYNLSFSGGVVTEYLAVADYLKRQGFAPRTLVVGIDDFNFTRPDLTPELPGFVTEQRPPDSLVGAYLSLDVLALSWRTFFDAEVPRSYFRYYDRDFTCRIGESAPSYRIDSEVERYSQGKNPFRGERVEYYRQLRARFPDARFIAYVPPVSVWRILGRYRAGQLDDYLRVIYDSGRLFDQVWDFSVPSPITADPSRTYDGSHYNLETNARIARTLSGEASDWGLELTRLSFEAYLEAYHRRLQEQERLLGARDGGGGLPPADGRSI